MQIWRGHKPRSFARPFKVSYCRLSTSHKATKQIEKVFLSYSVPQPAAHGSPVQKRGRCSDSEQRKNPCSALPGRLRVFKELLIIIWDIDRAFYIHWLNWCMFGSVSGGLPMNMPMTRSAHFFNKIGFSFFAMYVHMFWHLVIGDLHTA